MKLGLALLAIGATATRISDWDDLDDCYGPWFYDDFCNAYYQEDYCTNNDDDEDCIYWGSRYDDDDSSDDWWISCHDFYFKISC